jgi:flagellar hook-basal body complex protein FliE
MIEKATSSANIQSMLETLRTHSSQAAGNVQGLSTDAPEKTGFSDAVKQMFNQVNATQQSSRAMTEAYERGDDIPLTDVVLGMQKSSLSFEATLQVRNKVLKAYEDIMNMPV